MIWLPDMDLNHDKQIQSLLCYRYTIGQTSVPKVEFPGAESRLTVKTVKRQNVTTGRLRRAIAATGTLINTPLKPNAFRKFRRHEQAVVPKGHSTRLTPRSRLTAAFTARFNVLTLLTF